jgi:hypothetical protein
VHRNILPAGRRFRVAQALSAYESIGHISMRGFRLQAEDQRRPQPSA